MNVTDSTAGVQRKLPFYLRDNYAPVTEEIDATDPAVVGSLPPELSGRFFRIGANPIDRVPMHWFNSQRTGRATSPAQ